jgi:hypothetical protein
VFDKCWIYCWFRTLSTLLLSNFSKKQIKDNNMWLSSIPKQHKETELCASGLHSRICITPLGVHEDFTRMGRSSAKASIFQTLNFWVFFLDWGVTTGCLSHLLFHSCPFVILERHFSYPAQIFRGGRLLGPWMKGVSLEYWFQRSLLPLRHWEHLTQWELPPFWIKFYF